MTDLYVVLGPQTLILIAVVAIVAGFVKGAVGFAMPMILISTLGSFLPPDLALAALILPTLVSNVIQALRNGLGPALHSAWLHRVFIAALLVFIALASQLVEFLSDRALYLTLGIPLTIFAVLQLVGWRLTIRPDRRRRAEVGIGSLAGFIGGLSGVWGPPTVLYLTALETPKEEQMRVQGVVYGTGSVILTLGHLQSGILNASTAPLSAALVVPALIGLALGFTFGARLDQARFRKLTLLVLVVASLNLIRRGLMG